MFPPERLTEGVFSPKAQIQGADSKSRFRGLPEVEIRDFESGTSNRAAPRSDASGVAPSAEI